MTYPLGDRPMHRMSDPDPLTDSAVHRLALGTQVRLHLYGGATADVSLTGIRDVATWRDLSERIVRAMAIDVTHPRQMTFAGGAVMWGEVLDEPSGPTADHFDPPIRRYGARG